MSDLPDYCQNIVISFDVPDVLIGLVKCDIVKVKGVDLKTPTIAASLPISIENPAIAYDAANDRFKVDVEKTVAVLITSGTVAISGTVAVTQSGTWTVVVTQSGTWTVAATQSGTWTVTVSGTVAISGTVAVTQSGTWTVAISGTVAVTQSGTWTVTVNGTVAISGTVAVTQSGAWAVTVTSGSITVSGAVTVSTVGGTNIILDKLTQEAFLERRPIIKNDNGVVTPTAPPSNVTGNAALYIGKLFPRGCRGFLHALYIYCKRTGAGTVTLSFAPYVGDKAVASVTITPSADWDWQHALYDFPWSFDSLFIWISACSADVNVGYDAVSYDMLTSIDSGITWTTANYRLYAVAIMAGSTVGDVTIGGTVSLGDRSAYEYVHVTGDTLIKGTAGRLHTVTINSCTAAGSTTIYDSTTEGGTVIAIIAWVKDVSPITLTYDVLCKIGIFIGFNGAVNADITVSYI